MRIEVSSQSPWASSPPSSFSIRRQAVEQRMIARPTTPRKPHTYFGFFAAVIDHECAPARAGACWMRSWESTGGSPGRLYSRCGSLRGSRMMSPGLSCDRQFPVDSTRSDLARPDVMIADQLVRRGVEGRAIARRVNRRQTQKSPLDSASMTTPPVRRSDPRYVRQNVHGGPAAQPYAAFRSSYPASRSILANARVELETGHHIAGTEQRLRKHRFRGAGHSVP